MIHILYLKDKKKIYIKNVFFYINLRLNKFLYFNFQLINDVFI